MVNTAYFNLTRTRSGQFRYQFHSKHGDIILVGQEYFSKSDCLEAIASVRKVSKFERFFDRRTSSQGLFYFELRTLGGDIIGTSAHFEHFQAREDCLFAILNTAYDAEFKDTAL
jgi:uncharacterized protein